MDDDFVFGVINPLVRVFPCVTMSMAKHWQHGLCPRNTCFKYLAKTSYTSSWIVIKLRYSTFFCVSCRKIYFTNLGVNFTPISP